MRLYRNGTARFALAAALALTLSLAGRAAENAAAEPDPLDAFPAAEAGQVRYVVRVPAQADEGEYKVELLVGKTVRTDERNRYFFSGRLEEVELQGWGYQRYVLAELGPMVGTLMAAPPDAPQVDRFITLGGETRLFRYNSRMPLVVYVPDGVEVRYRVWTAGATGAAPRE